MSINEYIFENLEYKKRSKNEENWDKINLRKYTKTKQFKSEIRRKKKEKNKKILRYCTVLVVCLFFNILTILQRF